MPGRFSVQASAEPFAFADVRARPEAHLESLRTAWWGPYILFVWKNQQHLKEWLGLFAIRVGLGFAL